ncbi:MAG: tRNA dihydrouridine synthase DusB [Vicinamibacteria bacterium]
MNSDYISALNHEVPLARLGEFAPLKIGNIEVAAPVVLAPMAGVTNPPFRSICREFGAGLYVSEMITARPLVDGNPKTELLASFSPDETVRSLQLYGVDPHYVGEAVRILVSEGRVDHIDMNFGCPVRKVTSKGGGAALPLKPNLLRGIVGAAVRSAGHIPVTIKFRKGINDDLLTFRETGRVAEGEGCSAIALHARTAAQLYDGEADWSAITELKNTVRTIPVLGNGDIWEAHDALRMMRETGCDGVVVGRGCLGRPWLFRDLADVFAGREPQDPPKFGEISVTMMKHARGLAGFMGELAGMRAFRKHSAWYTKCFPGSAPLREALMRVESVDQLAETISVVDPQTPFPPAGVRVSRGKSGGTQRVALPEGYLDNLNDATPPGPEAETADSGG